MLKSHSSRVVALFVGLLSLSAADFSFGQSAYSFRSRSATAESRTSLSNRSFNAQNLSSLKGKYLTVNDVEYLVVNATPRRDGWGLQLPLTLIRRDHAEQLASFRKSSQYTSEKLCEVCWHKDRICRNCNSTGWVKGQQQYDRQLKLVTRKVYSLNPGVTLVLPGGVRLAYDPSKRALTDTQAASAGRQKYQSAIAARRQAYEEQQRLEREYRQRVAAARAAHVRQQELTQQAARAQQKRKSDESLRILANAAFHAAGKLWKSASDKQARDDREHERRMATDRAYSEDCYRRRQEAWTAYHAMQRNPG